MGVVLLAATLFLLAAPALAHAATPPVGKWHFDETFSTPNEGPDGTPDSSGKGRHLFSACNGCLTLMPDGKFASHLSQFQFCNEPPCGRANESALRTGGIFPQSVTLMAWVRRLGTPLNDQVIAAQAFDGRTCDRSAYRLRYDDGDGFSGLEFSVQAGGRTVASPSLGASNNVWDGGWHLVVGTYDRERVRLYIDGVEIGSGTPAPGQIEYGGAFGLFGVDGFTGNPAGCVQRNFEGGIDEMRVYERALRASEIKSLFDRSTGSEPPDLLPDVDVDGVPDASDNCPRIANSDQADADRDGKGAVCDAAVARLTAHPQPTCVNSLIYLNARQSQVDGPANYRFFFTEDAGSANRTVEVASGPDPLVPQRFGWSRQGEYLGERYGARVTGGWRGFGIEFGWFPTYGPSIRDPAFVTVEVTPTATGRAGFDSAVTRVDFAQGRSDESTARCPGGVQGPPAAPPIDEFLRQGERGEAYAVATECNSPSPCTGEVSLVTVPARVNRAGRGAQTAARKKKGKPVRTKRKRAKPKLLARKPYWIPPRSKAKITLKLKKRARRLLRRKRKMRAVLRLARVTRLGTTVGRQRLVTLRAKGKKPRKGKRKGKGKRPRKKKRR